MSKWGKFTPRLFVSEFEKKSFGVVLDQYI